VNLVCKCGGKSFSVELRDLPPDPAKGHKAIKEVKRFVCGSCGDYMLVFILFTGDWEWR
jgi:hypothetical protein